MALKPHSAPTNSAASAVLYAPESFARAFARRYRRRIKRHGMLASDGGVAQVLAVSVRGPAPYTQRILCTNEEVEGGIDRALPSGMACSIGKRLPYVTHESSLRAGHTGNLPVFLTATNSERVPELLGSPFLSSALDSIGLVEGECLQTAHAVSFTLRTPTIERVELAFQAVIQLATALPRERASTLPARFPQSLKPLSPIVLEWGILDPVLRVARIAEAHPDALRRLLGTAHHYATKVRKYLETTRYPDGDAAQVLRAFTESVALAEGRLAGVTPLPISRA